MIEPGSVRSRRIRKTLWPPSGRSPGSSMTGTHQASRMLPSWAPTRIAIRRPSPVLVGTPAGRAHRAAQEVADQVGVVLEAAGGDDDGAGGDRRGVPVRALELHAGDAAVGP